jgi:hypothetical protein
VHEGCAGRNVNFLLHAIVADKCDYWHTCHPLINFATLREGLLNAYEFIR